jgi:predicted CXXCH cytochrome family protein
MKGWLLLIAFLSGAAVLIVGWRLYGTHANPAGWQSHASPGDLSRAHAELKNDCAACHTPVQGPADAKCISCHANNTVLLQRQPTAFHADIGQCARCHTEHQGTNANLRKMDHATLARVGLTRLKDIRSESEAQLRTALLTWMRQHPSATSPTGSHPQISPLEMTLNCSGCHATKDRHSGLFGQECASCHATTAWTIAQFQHPSPDSFDCAQCHQAPPSHYMMHFEMVSKRIAHQEDSRVAECCGSAQVNQCYRCHQTTSWNDIKGVGWYKHH